MTRLSRSSAAARSACWPPGPAGVRRHPAELGRQFETGYCARRAGRSRRRSSAAVGPVLSGRLLLSHGDVPFPRVARRQQPPECFPGAHALAQPGHAQELVRRVQVLVSGGEREEQGLDPELALEQGGGRQRPGDVGLQHAAARVDPLQRGGGGPDRGVARPGWCRPATRAGSGRTVTVTPALRLRRDVRGDRGGTASGSWPGTSRHDTWPIARCGITVYLPPPEMPLTSSVGRSQRRSSMEYPASPGPRGGPARAGSPFRRMARSAISARRSAVSAGMPS